MREHVLKFAGAIFLTVLAMLGLGAALHILITLPFEGKGPEWVGAIGTVATLIGTIHLARTETRHRERQERLKARIYATVVQPRVRAAWNKVQSISDGLHPRNADKERAHFLDISQQLEEIVLCTHDELIALSAHPSAIARNLTIAGLRIKSLAPRVRLQAQNANPERRQVLAASLDSLTVDIGMIEGMLLQSMADCSVIEDELEKGVD